MLTIEERVLCAYTNIQGREEKLKKAISLEAGILRKKGIQMLPLRTQMFEIKK